VATIPKANPSTTSVKRSIANEVAIKDSRTINKSNLFCIAEFQPGARLGLPAPSTRQLRTNARDIDSAALQTSNFEPINP
jgi:hypothetical protein